MKIINNYVDYVQACMAKGTIGAYISVGVIGLIVLCAFLGIYYGAARGFSKSVIRIFTVGASAIGSMLAVMGISKLIIKYAVNNAGGEEQKVDALLNSYFPGLVDSMPQLVRPMLSEIDASTAAIFVMMIIAIIITPVLFIALFYLLRFLTLPLYKLLAGLAGAISYGRGIVSTILGAVVGLAQGVLIAAVVIIPISGLTGVAEEAREPLLGSGDEANGYIKLAYNTVIDDLADNPVFDLVDKYGGSMVYDTMTTVKINGEKKDMAGECIDAIRIVTDILPIAKPGYDWIHPGQTQRDALTNAVVDIGESELISSLIADVVRGMSKSVLNGSFDLKLSGAAKVLVDDAMLMLSTSTNETIVEDLDLVVDVYFIICDHKLIDTLRSGDPNAVRDILTNKGEDGKTTADAILDRLNEYDRAHTIVTSLTKLSLSMMQDALGFDEDTTEIYESVKEDMTNILNHNKSDFATEEEYKEQVSADLDQALADNNLNVDEETKKVMVDYIADNYGDHEGEITDKEINDALLSYYKAYADSLAKGEDPVIPDDVVIPDGVEIPGGGEG